MGRASRARRIAAVAAFGGTGAGAAYASFWGLMRQLARAARARIGPAEKPLAIDGRYGDGVGVDSALEPLRMAMLGDSTAAGLGATHGWETPGVRIALGLAAAAGRPVQLTCLAVVGAQSTALGPQTEKLLPLTPDIVVIMIGSNDVTHRVERAVSVAMLDQTVRRLGAAGCPVVVGTCPDLGTIEPLGRPLRWLARRASRALAAAQTVAVVEAGGRSVSLGDLLGPEFAAHPREMFSRDGFHPSATGYRHAAEVLLPSVLAALDLGPGADAAPDPSRGEGVGPVAAAAAAAADHVGSEVSAAQVRGHDRGPAGRWAVLRRRGTVPTQTGPTQTGPTQTGPARTGPAQTGPAQERPAAGSGAQR